MFMAEVNEDHDPLFISLLYRRYRCCLRHLLVLLANTVKIACVKFRRIIDSLSAYLFPTRLTVILSVYYLYGLPLLLSVALLCDCDEYFLSVVDCCVGICIVVLFAEYGIGNRRY